MKYIEHFTNAVNFLI